MKKLFSSLALILLILGLTLNAAEAKRFGGGKSFGYQRSAQHFSKPSPMNNAASAAAKPASGLT